jgi:hypothetical protein
VPGGLTILGAGSRTHCLAASDSIQMFFVEGDQVRFSRLKLQGASTAWSDTNNSRGIQAYEHQNIRIDHCELFGFSYATLFLLGATAQVDHCLIHHNLRSGLGYGVCVGSGSYVLVSDNEFSQCRHMLASNGGGTRKTHWEFMYNHVNGDNEALNPQSALDTHAGMDGTFVIESNLIENVQQAVGILDGCGLIRNNQFGGVTEAIYLGAATQDGKTGMPHDIEASQTSFVDPVTTKYRLGICQNISIDGTVVPETQTTTTSSALIIPRMQEMGEDGILSWN